jgi:transcriptional regulator with XRE-family HTH domain
MTGKQLAAALEAVGISQTDLARRLFVSPRAVRYWGEKGVPPTRLASVQEALALRPRVFLNREDRERIAELLDGIATGMPVSDAEPWKDAARLRDKIRAGLGGVLSG